MGEAKRRIDADHRQGQAHRFTGPGALGTALPSAVSSRRRDVHDDTLHWVDGSLIFRPEDSFQRMCHAAAAIFPISFPSGADSRPARLPVTRPETTSVVGLRLRHFGFGGGIRRDRRHSARAGDTV